MDKAALLALVIGIGGILLGNELEGGHLSSLLQFTAFLIVMAGTLGAVMLSHTTESLRKSLRMLRWILVSNEIDNLKEKVQSELVSAAQKSRKESILALEKDLPRMSDPFMQKVFRFIIDGVDPKVVADTFNLEISVKEKSYLQGAKVWADAGGFAPTIGIIGAVLGLIHVMGNLSDTSQLGKGIAVAFVATIYGVAFANLIFLPLGNRLKALTQKRIEIYEMILEGGLGILSGQSPFVVEQKLKGYTVESELS